MERNVLIINYMYKYNLPYTTSANLFPELNDVMEIQFLESALV